MPNSPASRPLRTLLVGAIIGLLAGTTAWPAAAVVPANGVTGVTVVGATVTPTETDLAGGFTVLTLDIALQSAVPLPDTLETPFDLDSTTIAVPVVNRGDGLVGDQSREAMVWWGDLARISGTPTDGVWHASTTVTGEWTGTWRLFALDVEGTDADADLTPLDVVFSIGQGELPPWSIASAPLGPVRVVTGNETWTPRVRVTDRATGLGIAAFMTDDTPGAHFAPDPRVPPGAWTARASSAGYFSYPPTALPRQFPVVAVAYAKRGTRGYSLEAVGCVRPVVKWQANERVAASGRTVTVNGNAWPAPSIYGAGSTNINLQVLVAGRWTTVVGNQIRANGRYTLTWTAPAAGTYQVRAYKPGSHVQCLRSVGVVLEAVPVTLR